MKISDYIKKAKSTLRPTYDLAGLTLGIVGEWGEFEYSIISNQNVRAQLDELGDVLYYTMLAQDFAFRLGFTSSERFFSDKTFSEMYSRESNNDLNSLLDMARRKVLTIPEIIKKVVYHGKTIGEGGGLLSTITLVEHIAQIADILGSDIDQVAQRNIEKLTERWGTE